jgi:cytochrome b pre-mRNA-processing protein 3
MASLRRGRARPVGAGPRSAQIGVMLFLRERRRERDAAEALYRVVAEASRRPALYAELGVPDTVEGRFESLLLHLFPVVDRLGSGEDADPGFSRLVAEAFVADMDATLREMGVGDLSVPRRVKSMYAAFGGRLAAYASAKGDRQALTEAVRRNVFDGAAGTQAARLAGYVQTAVAGLAEVPVAALKRGAPLFPDPLAA